MMTGAQRTKYEEELKELDRKAALSEKQFCVQVFEVAEDDENLNGALGLTLFHQDVLESKKALKKRAATVRRALKGDLGPDDLIVGHVYRARRPQEILFRGMNDRTIIWKGPFKVQYDGPSVKMGQHYPTVSIEEFLGWAKMDVTAAPGEDDVDEGEHRRAAEG